MTSSQKPGLYVDVSLVDEDPNNARLSFDEAKLKSLGAAMKAEGQLVPVLVRKVGDRFRLIDGARRYRAAKLAGIKQLRCEVQDGVDDAAAARMAATANLQREDLTPYEQARAFKIAIDAGVQKKEICERAGIVFNTLKARLEILDLPEEIGTRIGVAGFGLAHAQAFLGLVKQPALLAAALKGVDSLKELPPAYDLPNRIVRHLREKNLVRQIGEGFQPWEHHDLEKKLLPLAVAGVAYNNGHEVKLAIDVKVYDDIVKEGLAATKAKQAVERAKTSNANKGQKAEARQANELRKLTEQESSRLQLAGMVATLRDDKKVAPALFEIIRAWHGNDMMLGLYDYDAKPDRIEASWKAAGAACGADTEAIGSWLTKEAQPGKGTPAWFTKLKPARQLAFVVALMGTNEIGIGPGHIDASLAVALTGKVAKEWDAKARKEAERTLSAAKKPAKAARPAEEADEDDRDPDGGAPRMATKRPKKAPKSKPAAKKPAKAVAKTHASLAKAQAKLAEKAKAEKPAKSEKAKAGKQATLATLVAQAADQAVAHVHAVESAPLAE